MRGFQYWNDCGRQMRDIANGAKDENTRRSLHAQADGYFRMAELAERKGAPKEETAQCATCMFYREVYTDSKIGYCHRYPPTTPEVQVLSTTWCGEWKQRNG